MRFYKREADRENDQNIEKKEGHAFRRGPLFLKNAPIIPDQRVYYQHKPRNDPHNDKERDGDPENGAFTRTGEKSEESPDHHRNAHDDRTAPDHSPERRRILPGYTSAMIPVNGADIAAHIENAEQGYENTENDKTDDRTSPPDENAMIISLFHIILFQRA